MRILVTNDDGINAEGIAILARVAAELSDDVWVVAPETDQSGVSHSLSLHDPLRLRDLGGQRFAVSGTPTDCVIMAVRHLFKDVLPDLVLSGINIGQNVAEDVIYSGTVAGAMEGAILGIPSIALSQVYGPGGRGDANWDCSATHAGEVVRRVVKAGIEPGILVNVNFPSCAPEQVAGIAVTAQGRRNLALLKVEERLDGRNKPYYWLMGARNPHEPVDGTDLWAVRNNRISVTPLQIDFTHEPTMTRYAGLFHGLRG
ncbi:5'-nucleotidase [Pseudochelatococcus lubricantis]|uniref:5'-nucleotidase SurE n=1 Tax=Pseudochelatococcus lubricantis TaxID=1538102 RepID=A0ABX0UXY2_9HYPH|nr:5'/3'-nucleotidase SurE [Pseudochelatococcus lubricantis]NIJ57813.1 5'-nucleotidase [Pseudochelatococcus lubricantis]